MTNKKGFIALVLMMIFSLSMITANAGEVNQETSVNQETRVRQERTRDFAGTFEERFEERMATMQAKVAEVIAERTANYDARVAEAEEKITLRLQVVEEFAPELISGYEDAFAAHLGVHELLFNTNMTKQDAYFSETIAQAYVLKDEVVAEVEAGTMTYKEAAEAIRTYLTNRHEDFVAIKEAYKAEIEPLNEANEANKVIVDGLRVELRAAIEASDVDTANTIIAALLEYLTVHTDYDSAKLVILETY